MSQLINGIQRYKHRLATIALVFGFFVDIITFRSLNLTLALMLLSVHLFIVAFTIILLTMPFHKSKDSLLTKIRSWLPVVQQYSMGNLLSAFLILYSASGSFVASWPFLALVAVAAIGNETIRLEKYRLPFQTSLFFLNLLLFLALLTPIIFASISATTFLTSVMFSIFIFAVFRRILWLVARQPFSHNRKNINRGAFGIVALILLLYFVNLIPPIPLTLKDVGFYHDVSRFEGGYIASDEDRSLFENYFGIFGKTLHLANGESAYVFTAVFAPAKLGTQVVHKWQYYSEVRREWVTQNTVHFPIVGGRSGGYRGYSLTENPNPGKWRISVETTRGQVIGRSYLTIQRVSKTPPVQYKELQ